MERLTEICTCDDFTDEPCPRHKRESELQNQLIFYKNIIDEASNCLVCACIGDLSEIIDNTYEILERKYEDTIKHKE